MNVFQFIEENKHQVHYCECVIDRFGNVFNAIPSHTIFLEQIYRSKGKNPELIPITASPIDYFIEELNYVAVWYGFARASKISSYQWFSLRKLQQAKLIQPRDFRIRIWYEKSIVELNDGLGKGKWDYEKYLIERNKIQDKCKELVL